jgi:starch-binding outer membrane protein, SusD/RagB family
MIYKKRFIILFSILISVFHGCEDFFDPAQEVVINRDKFFEEFDDFQSAALGIYNLQQNLAEQLIILGELRGDLMEITEFADRDLIEVYNFNISKSNKYASPENFYKLIANCNALISELVEFRPEVMDAESQIGSFDRLFGEVQCMRAWAYFNAVRIYGKVPYIHPFLTSSSDIVDYVENGITYVDSVKILYDQFGYLNDTLLNQVIELPKVFMDMETVVDSFTFILENDVKIVGGYAERDASWSVSCWDKYSYSALLAQMYLFRGDLIKAKEYLDIFLYNYDSETSAIRFGLDNRFSNQSWRNILTGIDGYEHIFSIWFDKDYKQQHNLQKIFGYEGGNKYMVKPTAYAISTWESIFDNMKMNYNSAEPQKTKLTRPGVPGDFYRGHSVSFLYMKDGIPMENSEVRNMLILKQEERFGEANSIMIGVDTVLYKYSYNKNPFDRDANILIYRAGGMHLYAAEVLTLMTDISRGRSIVNDGWYSSRLGHQGVRGRVGFGETSSSQGFSAPDEGILVGQYVYIHDPSTNEVTGYRSLPTLYDKQIYLVDKIIEERIRELAFEGERFYDLMRVAKRRDDPAYLADRVSAKFPSDKREIIRQTLMNEENWYVNYFDDFDKD